jgi:hypothetical protein
VTGAAADLIAEQARDEVHVRILNQNFLFLKVVSRPFELAVLVRRLKSFAVPPRYRSKKNFTSPGVTGSPLWNLTPGRRVKSTASPSLDMAHDSARLGADAAPGMGLRKASWSA